METNKKHCMLTIVNPVNLLVSDEYERAAGIHGKVFASAHEGYGVITKEVKEAGDEWEEAEKSLRVLISAIQHENAQGIIDAADHIRDVAVNGAAELIQVAAMCDKMIETVKGAGT